MFVALQTNATSLGSCSTCGTGPVSDDVLTVDCVGSCFSCILLFTGEGELVDVIENLLTIKACIDAITAKEESERAQALADFAVALGLDKGSVKTLLENLSGVLSCGSCFKCLTHGIQYNPPDADPTRIPVDTCQGFENMRQSLCANCKGTWFIRSPAVAKLQCNHDITIAITACERDGIQATANDICNRMYGYNCPLPRWCVNHHKAAD